MAFDLWHRFLSKNIFKILKSATRYHTGGTPTNLKKERNMRVDRRRGRRWQLCHFLLLLIFFLKICRWSFYKLTHSVLQVKIDNICGVERRNPANSTKDEIWVFRWFWETEACSIEWTYAQSCAIKSDWKIRGEGLYLLQLLERTRLRETRFPRKVKTCC